MSEKLSPKAPSQILIYQAKKGQTKPGALTLISNRQPNSFIFYIPQAFHAESGMRSHIAESLIHFLNN